MIWSIKLWSLFCVRFKFSCGYLYEKRLSFSICVHLSTPVFPHSILSTFIAAFNFGIDVAIIEQKIISWCCINFIMQLLKEVVLHHLQANSYYESVFCMSFIKAICYNFFGDKDPFYYAFLCFLVSLMMSTPSLRLLSSLPEYKMVFQSLCHRPISCPSSFPFSKVL